MRCVVTVLVQLGSFKLREILFFCRNLWRSDAWMWYRDAEKNNIFLRLKVTSFYSSSFTLHHLKPQSCVHAHARRIHETRFRYDAYGSPFPSSPCCRRARRWGDVVWRCGVYVRMYVWAMLVNCKARANCTDCPCWHSAPRPCHDLVGAATDAAMVTCMRSVPQNAGLKIDGLGAVRAILIIDKILIY